MQVTKTSAITGITRTKELDISEDQYQSWQNGKVAQEAFPNLSADDREFLITGIVQEEWDEHFS